MSAMYILIVLRLTASNGDFVSMQEFDSLETCKVAAQFVVNAGRGPFGATSGISAECVKK